MLITKDDKILLMKHKNSLGVETWYAPGGHLEAGGEHGAEAGQIGFLRQVLNGCARLREAFSGIGLY